MKYVDKIDYYNIPSYLELSIGTDRIVLLNTEEVIELKNQHTLAIVAGYLTIQFLNFSRQGKPFHQSKQYIADVLRISTTTLSRNLKILQKIGLISKRKSYKIHSYGQEMHVHHWATVKKSLRFESDRFTEEELGRMHYSVKDKAEDLRTEQEKSNKVKNLTKIKDYEKKIKLIKSNIWR